MVQTSQVEAVHRYLSGFPEQMVNMMLHH